MCMGSSGGGDYNMLLEWLVGRSELMKDRRMEFSQDRKEDL